MSYSYLEIYICWKVDSEAKIDLPIDADYTRTDLDRLDVHCGWSQASDFFLHAISDSRIHSGAIRQHCVGVKVLMGVQVTLHNGVVCGLVHTCRKPRAS